MSWLSNLRVRLKQEETLTPYLFILPITLFLVLFIVYPIVRSVYMSFLDYKLTVGTIKFIGLENYKNVLFDKVFWVTLGNTFIWVGLGVFFQLFFGLILALILNQEFWGRGFVRSILMIPWVTPGVLIALMWTWMYDGNFGIINHLLQKMGMISEFVPWLAQTESSLYAVTITIVCQGIPFFTLMLLASLQSIPKDMYEASSIDGAGKISQFFNITLPMLRSTIYVTTLLRIIWVANSVDIIYTMTGGGPGYSSMTLSIYTFIKARASFDFGYSATLSLYLTLILLTVIIFYVKERVKEDA